MRLQQTEISKIIEFANVTFGEGISLYLFGSRVDDNLRGGDIDLLVESNFNIEKESQMKFLYKIFRHITERKVDLLVVNTNTERVNLGIYKEAKAKGIKLC